MKKLFGLMAAAALTASAGFVMAEEGGAHQQQGAGQQGAEQQKGAQQYKHDAQKQAQAQAQLKRHMVTGRIVDIDQEKGDLKVETEEGQLEFNFPPASLQGYSEGDQVRLDVSIRPAQPKQQGGQKPQGGGQMKQPGGQQGGQQQGQQPGGAQQGGQQR